MRVVILAVALTTAVPAIAEPRPPATTRECTARPHAFDALATGAPTLKRLDQLPRAKQFLTVFREIDRCPAPVIVADDIGATPRP